MQPKIYKITSCFGKFLTVDDDNTVIQSDTGNFLLLYINEEKKKSYIFSENPKEKLRVRGSLLQSPVIQVDIHKKDDDYSFYLSAEKKFLSAQPNMMVNGDRNILDEWEIFSISPYAISENSEKYVLDSIKSIDMFLNNTLPYNQFLREKSSEALFGIIANLFSLPPDALKNLSLAFMSNTKWALIIENYFPSDIWASHALKDLYLWLNDRDGYSKNSNNVIGYEFDFLGCDGISQPGRGLMAASPVEFLVRTIRSHVTARKNVCVLATGRNEAIYYLEWIAYFRSIGIESFFIYTNDNADKSENLLEILENNNIVRYYRSESHDGVSMQWKAYAHALSINPEILDYKWTIVCDIDEFFVFNKNMFSNIHDYISFLERRNPDNIAVAWCCIGASNQKKWKDAPLMERFNSNPFHERILVKSIFKTHFAGNSHSHFPIELDNYHMTYQNSAGITLMIDVSNPYGRAVDSQPDFRMAVFYHYYFKSIEEFLWKSSRNRGDYAKVSTVSTQTFDEGQGNFFWEHYQTNRDTLIPMLPDIHDFHKDFLNEYDYLMSLKHVKPLYVEIKKEFSEKISEIIEHSKREDIYKTIPDCYKRMLSHLDEDE